MTYPGQRKPPDYSLKTGAKTFGIALGIGLVLCGGFYGTVAAVGDDSEGGGPDVVEVTSAPARTGRFNVPSTLAVTTAAPSASPTPSPKPPPVKKPPAPKTTKPKPPPPEDEPDDVYYANCSEARAAGAAPLYRGEPGYRSALDRDKDGVACETD